MRALLLASLVASCYSPQYVDGGLKCAPGGLCPEGMACYSGACWTHSPIVTGDGAAPDVVAPDSAGETIPTVRFVGQPCDPSNVGTSARTDNCAGGLVCVDGNAGSTCFKRCASNVDCGDAVCEQRQVDVTTGASQLVCGPSASPCDPVARTGCSTGETCYLSSARTVCETTSGDGQQTSCIYSRECLPGYTCATSGPGAGRCFPVCAVVGGACPGVLSCQAASGSYSYCF